MALSGTHVARGSVARVSRRLYYCVPKGDPPAKGKVKDQKRVGLSAYCGEEAHITYKVGRDNVNLEITIRLTCADCGGWEGAFGDLPVTVWD
jgi:hypothetical protein